MPAHMLGNDMHVRAMKIISNNFLHVANMYVLQLLIRENIGHACLFIVHDGIWAMFLPFLAFSICWLTHCH